MIPPAGRLKPDIVEKRTPRCRYQDSDALKDQDQKPPNYGGEPQHEQRKGRKKSTPKNGRLDRLAFYVLKRME
jgi:hypothetical protein